MAKYYFADITDQSITSGYASIVIETHVAEIANDDTEAMPLAEKLGGVVEVWEKPVRGKSIQPLSEVSELEVGN